MNGAIREDKRACEINENMARDSDREQGGAKRKNTSS